MATTAFEINFDGLVGPTHNYSGLSFGNIASTSHKASSSNPREAALQGLEKMKKLADLGLKQAVLPPHERPEVQTLRRLGFRGSDATILALAKKDAPEVLSACSSASSMWTANAATTAPSADTQDGKVHFTPANLSSKFHRSIEPETTTRVLRAIFRDPNHFVHHPTLPSGGFFGDEGAANHTRFAPAYGKRGVQFFVFGRYAFNPPGGGEKVEPKKFPARQTYEASAAVARLHLLDPQNVVFAQQHPDAIDGGAFHNDVVSVGNQDALFYHEQAFLDSERVLAGLAERFQKVSGKELQLIQVPQSKVSLQDAVKSYLFNSQLVSLPEGGMALIAPSECQENLAVRDFLREFMGSSAAGPIKEVLFMDVRQSMQNGGGPACLRFRVVLNQDELKHANSHVFFTDELYSKLTEWVKKHYRDRLELDDLADVKLLNECRSALDELTQIMNLGSIYPFQL